MAARGEEVIRTSDDREITILFTNRALAQAEERLGEPIIVIAGKLANGQVGMNQVVQLLRCGMEASDRDRGGQGRVSVQDAYAVIDDVGFLNVVPVIITAMTGCLSYGAT